MPQLLRANNRVADRQWRGGSASPVTVGGSTRAPDAWRAAADNLTAPTPTTIDHLWLDDSATDLARTLAVLESDEPAEDIASWLANFD